MKAIRWGGLISFVVLVAIVVVIALLSVISLMTIPMSVGQYRKYIVNETALDIVHFLRLSQDNAKVQKHGESSGVKILSDSFIVFSGDSYVTRNINMDEVYDLPSSISIEGVKEVVFQEITGSPSDFGDIVVSAGVHNYSIHISDRGLIEKI